MSSIRRTFVILSAAIPLVLAASAHACFMRAPLPVQVWMDHINVDIVNDVASKTYDCVFKNPNSRAVIGGECYMELEPGTFVEKMSVTVDGKTMEAEILDVKKANEVFQDIVRRGGSPALLEYYGNQLIRTKVPRINPGGTVRVKLTYTTVLKPQNGLVRLQMLNTNPKTLMQKLQSAGVTINFKSDRPIQNIYSPTHPIKVVEKPEWDISVEWSEKDYLPKQPFVLYYQSSPQKVGASLIAHRERGQDGHFMLMLSPSQGKNADKFEPLAKDVVFCVDTSGSMIEGNKMEQARAALKYCLEQLRRGDRFNIVEFSTETHSFRDKPVKLNDENLKPALEYTANLHPRGGTAIHEALKKSLDQLNSKDRLKMIVFATDGLPTIGERDPKTILKDVEQWNRQDVRIFCFGEGIDVNTKLLDGLSLEHRGQSDYILPEEDISKIISRFFDRVGTPVMSDISIKIDGLMVRDVQPTTVSDLFQGEQVAVFGQYSGHGKKNVTIEGFWNGEKQKLTFEVEFPERSDSEKHAFVPRLWAGQQVDFLLREIRKQDKPEQELVDEVVRLAKRYGIVTPYTTFLMGEDLFDPKPKHYYRNRVLEQAQTDVTSGAAPELKRAVTEGAKDQALNRQSNAAGSARSYDAFAEKELRKQGRAETSSLQAIRYIGNRTFYKQGEYWLESEFEQEKSSELTDVEVGSPEYFELVEADESIPKFLALEQLIVNVKGRWYRIQQRNKS